jgi:hypothetical protein
MAREGYANQAARKAEHDALIPVRDAASALRAAVEGEKRIDRTCSAREVGDAITVNGKIAAFGLALGEPAIRGLLGRLESPALGYVLGLRNRIVEEARKPQGERDSTALQADKRKIADVLAHECRRAGDVPLKLRTRTALGDVFAIVSPSYSPADAPAVLDQIVRDLPADAKGSWSYDPASTAWELRADVWTPTPIAEQAVGEAFRGYVSFRARDNGTARFRGGGGVELIRCLNASTYTANGVDVSRVHRGEVLYDVGRMLRGATKAIDALCQAWGQNRETVIELPADGDKRVTIEQAIPGFWRWLLLDRKSELVGVLPGRSEARVDGLTKAFFQERRDDKRLVRSDLAQGWTRYIQHESPDVRREAEAAIGDWLVSGAPVGCELRS